jgi:glutathione S-transferase
MYTLFYSPGTASMAVHLALIEIGAPYRLQRLDFGKDEQRAADYLKMNPRGQVPTLVIDGRPYFEAAALVMILAERHPEARLAPPPGSPTRAEWYQWSVFFANSLAPAYRQWFYPADLGYDEHPPVVREALRTKIEEAWSLVDAQLAARGPYVLGADFSSVDLLALMYMRWSRNMPKPVTAWPALREYADRLRARPSWARMYEVEELTDWRA